MNDMSYAQTHLCITYAPASLKAAWNYYDNQKNTSTTFTNDTK